MELNKITEEMFEFLFQEYSVSKEQVLNLEYDEDLRQKLLHDLTWIECDGLEADADEETIHRGDLAADIITYISYKPPYDEKTLPCPICGAIQLTEEGGFEVCHVCGWEDDIVSREHPDGLSAHPKYSQNVAREAWERGETLWPQFPNPKSK